MGDVAKVPRVFQNREGGNFDDLISFSEFAIELVPSDSDIEEACGASIAAILNSSCRVRIREEKMNPVSSISI